MQCLACPTPGVAPAACGHALCSTCAPQVYALAPMCPTCRTPPTWAELARVYPGEPYRPLGVAWRAHVISALARARVVTMVAALMFMQILACIIMGSLTSRFASVLLIVCAFEICTVTAHMRMIPVPTPQIAAALWIEYVNRRKETLRRIFFALVSFLAVSYILV